MLHSKQKKELLSVAQKKLTLEELADGIALDNKGNYKSQFDEENSSSFSFDIARK